MKKSLITLAAASIAASASAEIRILDENLAGVTKDTNGYYHVSEDLTLAALNSDGEQISHILPSYVFVQDGAVLTIAAGAIIRGEPGAGSGGATGSLGDAGHEPGTLIITRTGQCVAEGTKANPIIFTTAAVDVGGDNVADSIDYSGAYITTSFNEAHFLDTDPINAPLGPAVETIDGKAGLSALADGTDEVTGFTEYQGLWGGVIILGSAPTSIGDIDTSSDVIVKDTKGAFPHIVNPMEGQIEGLNNPKVGVYSIYGGRNPNDSSGSYKYISLRHGGYKIANANEINGFTLGGVGFGTKFEYIEVYNNQDDAIEWFGGTVNSRYLAAIFNNDDSFDMDEGYTGLGQFWFSFQNDDKDNGDTAGEHDGTDAAGYSVDQFAAAANSATSSATNLLGTGDAGGGLVFTYPTIYNATYVGSGLYGKAKGTNSGAGIGDNHKGNHVFTLRDSWGGAYFNSIFSDHKREGIWLAKDGDERWDLGDIVFRSNVWYGDNAAYTASTFAKDTNSSESTTSAGDANWGANSTRVLQVFNNTGAAFSNNIFSSDPFAATNRVENAANTAYNGQIARRGYDSNFRASHGGFDPAEVTSAVTSLTPEPYTSTFFVDAGYVGAFNPNADSNNQALWTDDWTVFFDLFYENQ